LLGGEIGFQRGPGQASNPTEQIDLERAQSDAGRVELGFDGCAGSAELVDVFGTSAADVTIDPRQQIGALYSVLRSRSLNVGQRAAQIAVVGECQLDHLL